MTNAPTSMLVLKNEAGDYFLIPQETVERSRVPAEHTAEVERLLAEADGDVSGYFVNQVYGGVRLLGRVSFIMTVPFLLAMDGMERQP